MQLLVIKFKIISHVFYIVEISAFKMFKILKLSYLKYLITQGDQKVSVHLMITIHKVTSNVQSVPVSRQTFIDTPNCILENRVQYRAVHVPNVFCDGHLQIINFVLQSSGAQRLFDHRRFVEPQCLYLLGHRAQNSRASGTGRSVR
jgi:hypothetical protein